MICAICRRNPASMGVLCDECSQELCAPPTISPEQIVGHALDPTDAALIDVWGRVHPLDGPTTIGRSHSTVTILEPSVSRRHADLARGKAAWAIRDLGSTNGTFVEDLRVAESLPLADGAKLRFGDVAFYFTLDSSALPRPPRLRAIGQTRAPTEPVVAVPTQEIGAERPTVTFRRYETTGGGGVVEIDGKRVQLTIAQLELVTLLVTRMIDDVGAPDGERGFVQGSEIVTLSLDSVQPGFDNVRQLVRRVRRAFLKSGIGDLIESRHGLGYRLRVMPRVVPPTQAD